MTAIVYTLTCMHTHTRTHTNTHTHTHTHTHIDPYAVVSFGRYTQKSRRASDTVSPQWEETLLFKKMEMYGEQSMVFQYPPPVVIEFFDKDVVVSLQGHFLSHEMDSLISSAQQLLLD